MIKSYPIILALFLSACGADGPPERPASQNSHGVSVSGTVSVGVAGN